MSFKKLIGTMLVSSMLVSAFASVASAAVVFDYDEGYYISNVDDVADRTPYIETSVTKLTSEQVVALQDKVTGISNKKLKATAYGNTANWDVYQIDGTVKGVGPLGVGYDEDDNAAFVKLKAIDAGLNFSSLTALGAKATAWDAAVANAVEANTGTAWSLKNDGNKGGCFLQLLDAFPKEGETAEGNLRDLEYKYTLYIVLPTGTTMTLPFDTSDASVQYMIRNGVEGHTGTDGSLIVNKVATRSASVALAAAANKDVESVSLNESAISLFVGGTTKTLAETVLPNDATNKNVTWTSENTEIATVANGVVTAVAPGKTKITVTTEDGGKTATCNVVVNPAAVDGDDITTIDKNASLTDLSGASLDANYYYAAAKIDKTLDTAAYDYKIVATDDKEETNEWTFADGGYEFSGAKVDFIAIVKSATHKIVNIALQAYTK